MYFNSKQSSKRKMFSNLLKSLQIMYSGESCHYTSNLSINRIFHKILQKISLLFATGKRVVVKTRIEFLLEFEGLDGDFYLLCICFHVQYDYLIKLREYSNYSIY